MLEEIRIDNLGVICEASTQFHSGLTVLTGETGAGKTMIVTSLHLLSGARADAGRVRLGAERAVVEGRFSTAGIVGDAADEVEALLDASGGERDEDGSIIALRTVGGDGRSRAHLGGRGVPAGTLAEFTSSLLTVHGQNDQLRLQRPGEQLAALDRFGDKTIAPLLARYRKHRDEWVRARSELAERTSRARELAQEADQLTYSLEEIDAVAPQPGEDEAIVADVRRLSDLDSLRATAEDAREALSGADEMDDSSTSGALEQLSQARARLEASGDRELEVLGPRLEEAITVVTDVATDLARYLSELPNESVALDSLLSRQAELKTLTRKYAPDVDGVIAWANQSRQRLTHLDVSTEALTELSRKVEESAAATAQAAVKLSEVRRKAAVKLSKAVSAELAGLAMGRAQLEVAVQSRAAGAQDLAPLEVLGEAVHAGASGVDDVEFRLSAHSGAAALPIGKSASGGELSRVMLALEVVLAGSDTGTTMVFDEVDAGVGGRAAVEIGKRLARLARTHQVIVVTHLPQVAAFADTHLVVDKSDANGVVSSGVRTLTEEQRVVELARMLAGLDDTETGRAHAEELLATANAERAGAG